MTRKTWILQDDSSAPKESLSDIAIIHGHHQHRKGTARPETRLYKIGAYDA